MDVLKAKQIQKSYGGLTVLSNVSFLLEKGQKVALVGENGTGKTTLLKIVAGVESPDSGEVKVSKKTCIGYLPQDTSLFGDETVYVYLRRVAGIDVLERQVQEFSSRLSSSAEVEQYNEVNGKYERLNGYVFDHRMEVTLAGFGLEGSSLHYRVSDLSSGQKSKVALAGILLKGVDLLLLDEPTNNLDLPALVWLEDFLKRSEAACIVVSHDRRFLDRTMRKIFELDWRTRTVTTTGGTYSDYLEMVSRRVVNQRLHHEAQQKEIRRLNISAREKRDDARKGSSWKGSDNDKSLKGFKRDRAGKSFKTAKVIERRIQQIEIIERPFERDPFKIPLKAEVKSGTLNIRLVDVVVGYPNSFMVGPISFELRYGNRVGIIGLNGTGKSTLLKTITGQLAARGGTIEIGSGVKIGNMMQEHESLPRDLTLLEFLKERAGLNHQESYSKLAKFGLVETQVKRPINTLSPGGRARLLLALFSAQSVNTLILDEPTNHLDLEALEALEETVEAYRGTILLVSHDRYFLEKAQLDTTYSLSEGILTKIPDYKTYVAQAEERASQLLKLL